MQAASRTQEDPKTVPYVCEAIEKEPWIIRVWYFILHRTCSSFHLKNMKPSYSYRGCPPCLIQAMLVFMATFRGHNGITLHLTAVFSLLNLKEIFHDKHETTHTSWINTRTYRYLSIDLSLRHENKEHHLSGWRHTPTEWQLISILHLNCWIHIPTL